MAKRIKVEWFIDNIYEVVLYDSEGNRFSKFQGSLSDCEAYIRLQEAGHMK